MVVDFLLRFVRQLLCRVQELMKEVNNRAAYGLAAIESALGPLASDRLEPFGGMMMR